MLLHKNNCWHNDQNLVHHYKTLWHTSESTLFFPEEFLCRFSTCIHCWASGSERLLDRSLGVFPSSLEQLFESEGEDSLDWGLAASVSSLVWPFTRAGSTICWLTGEDDTVAHAERERLSTNTWVWWGLLFSESGKITVQLQNNTAKQWQVQ